jgi:hypothetical protein
MGGDSLRISSADQTEVPSFPGGWLDIYTIDANRGRAQEICAMSRLYIWHQNFSDFRIASLFLQDFLDSFQGGRVVGTALKIENLDFHLFVAPLCESG